MKKRNNNYYKPLAILIIIILLGLIIMGIFSFLNKYQKITLNEIESQAETLDQKKVEYSGILESGFETSNLDGKIWLETTKNTQYIPNIDEFPGLNSNYSHAKVKVYGILMTKKQGYGHLGFAKYQIVANKIELLEKLNLKK